MGHLPAQQVGPLQVHQHHHDLHIRMSESRQFLMIAAWMRMKVTSSLYFLIQYSVLLISEEADGDSSSEEDQETVDLCNEQYTQDDVDTEAPQQTPKETPEKTPKETPKQSGAPADDHIDIPLTEEEITILTSGEEEGV